MSAAPPSLDTSCPSDTEASSMHMSPDTGSGPTKSAMPSPDSVSRIVTVGGQDARTGNEVSIRYTDCELHAEGNFSVIFAAKMLGTERKEGGYEEDSKIAIKKILADKRFRNRELQIMRVIRHPNIVELRAFYYSKGDKEGDIYLSLILEFVPETVHRACRHYSKLKQAMPMFQIKLYMYQLFRALAYLHSKGIVHGDIKPQNLLLTPALGLVKVCDFGAANLVNGEVDHGHMCSLYYRAPELILGISTVATSMDIWSAGCVMGGMMLGQPLFLGDSAMDQLVEIVKVLGAPTLDDIQAMNPKHADHKFPQIPSYPWEKVFRPQIPAAAVDLIRPVLVYKPEDRLSASEALVHEFFDDLRVAGAVLPNGKKLPELFDFTQEELSIRPELLHRLVPPHAASALKACDIDIEAFEPTILEHVSLQKVTVI